VGVVFLGTPHRGTVASRWGEWVAKTTKFVGSEDQILKGLRDGSEDLQDLLYHFSLLVNRNSTKLVCFFEQHLTDYGKRAQLGAMVSWKEMVGLPLSLVPFFFELII
jgi:hypothetical protein